MEQRIGAYVQLLNHYEARVRVVGETAKAWRLSNGGIVKKAKEGKSWMWARMFSRLNVNQSARPFYSFGNWGYYTNDHEGQVMPGFTADPPGAEICGTYKIVFVAALLRYDNRQNKAKIFLRRQPESRSSRLIIKEERRMFAVGSSNRLSTGRQRRTSIQCETLYSGKVELDRESVEIDRYFGPGYNFYGFSADSEARQSYGPMPSNSGLIVTKLNDNKGRIYKVDSPKAFKLVMKECGKVRKSIRYTSQEEETEVARRICKCKHFSFLCTNLGLPCSAAALITSFVHQHEPYIFAEPGDLWLDIKLTTPNRTYVLARPCSNEDVESLPSSVDSSLRLRLRLV
jgi:hypothetical protein